MPISSRWSASLRGLGYGLRTADGLSEPDGGRSSLEGSSELSADAGEILHDGRVVRLEQKGAAESLKRVMGAAELLVGGSQVVPCLGVSGVLGQRFAVGRGRFREAVELSIDDGKIEPCGAARGQSAGFFEWGKRLGMVVEMFFFRAEREPSRRIQRVELHRTVIGVQGVLAEAGGRVGSAQPQPGITIATFERGGFPQRRNRLRRLAAEEEGFSQAAPGVGRVWGGACLFAK